MSNIQDRAAIALEHHNAGRLAEAEVVYREVLHERADYPAIHHNLGVLLVNTARINEGIEQFQKAVVIDPEYEPAYWSMAKAMQQACRFKEAAKACEEVISINPEHYGAQLALGRLLLKLGQRGRALDIFARTMDLRRGENRVGPLDNSLKTTTRAKLLHDIEQFRYLAGRKRDSERVSALARTYEFAIKSIEWPSDDHQTISMTEEQVELFGGSYNYPNFMADAAEFPASTINNDVSTDEISKAFKVSTPGVAWFDNLLTPEALSRLSQYLLGSTIWFDFSHIPGFLASYLEDGLACPLLLQIADNVREKFPDILGDHPMTQAWAFKGLIGEKPIDLHLDDAAVSLNFWLTPDQANLEPGRGGLQIYTKRPPNDWVIKDYEQDKESVKAFIKGHENRKTIIPYACNRAVLFDSKLFHGSDSPKFLSGYENYRINITLLFGNS